MTCHGTQPGSGTAGTSVAPILQPAITISNWSG